MIKDSKSIIKEIVYMNEYFNNYYDKNIKLNENSKIDEKEILNLLKNIKDSIKLIEDSIEINNTQAIMSTTGVGIEYIKIPYGGASGSNILNGGGEGSYIVSEKKIK